MQLVWLQVMSHRVLSASALVGCLLIACGGKAFSGGSSSSSSGGSSGGSSSSSGSSSGGSSSGGSSSGGSSSGGGGCVDIDYATYDVSCNSVSDCFPIQVGQVCDGQCACGDYAANVSEQARYEAALSSLKLAACFCPATLLACVGHQCSVQGGTTADASAPPDSGACVYVDLSTYEQSCKTDADCTEITAGTLCPGNCFCGGSAINVSGDSRYGEQVASIQPGVCGCPAEGVPRCVGGTCTICGPGNNQPPGCPDGG
jgi:hypothetical protein